MTPAEACLTIALFLTALAVIMAAILLVGRAHDAWTTYVRED
ncbi:hypothetical protein [Labrys wisconsinensis]|uniref:Uncharacterized protein n=1 Tax=Labrys wisconsinensis TaxID=425677 RepID=A0ABU0JPF0_9HYPH|nr:hypothetical protein [Labrys wisconsinensis]MDQ0475258.1 hypothetical protein [Labrys wisconsinensis]